MNDRDLAMNLVDELNSLSIQPLNHQQELTNASDSNIQLQHKCYFSKLPSECVYAIIDNFKYDIKTLYRLLCVNKMFFAISIRHLYSDPFNTLLKAKKDPFYMKRVEMLVVNILVSFLNARVKEEISIPGNCRSPTDIVSQTLTQFGLKLAIPFESSSGTSLLQRVYDNFGKNAEPEDASSSNATAQPMSTDYSKLISKLIPGGWRFFRRYYLIRLSDFPDEIREEGDVETDDPDEEDISNGAPHNLDYSRKPLPNQVALSRQNTKVVDKDHPYTTRVNSIYLRELRMSVTQMLVHYNHENITILSIEIDKVARMIPYATQLIYLETVYLTHGPDPIHSFVSDMCMFITRNQSISPRGKSLNIEFCGNWVPSMRYVPRAYSSTDLETYLADGAAFRQKGVLEVGSIMKILEAVKRPRTLRIQDLANFFNLADKIETDLLVELHDMDTERFEMGERAAMESFLRSCCNLRVLRLGIMHHEMFQWTENSKSLMKLEELYISSKNVYHAAIKSFNEAMSTFSFSMKKATLEQRTSDLAELPVGVRNELILRSLRLQHQTLANSIGDFTMPLPQLTSLVIVLKDVANINIGSFKNCPNLEELMIEFGPTEENLIRPHGNAPTGPPSLTTPLNANWTQETIDYGLFPVWNLPRLKYLRLEKMAAMRFNFASLPTMQQLKALKLVAEGCDLIYNYSNTNDYLFRQQKAPPSQLTTDTPDFDFSQGYGIFGAFTDQEWTLPILESISMSGTPTAFFCMEYLRHFPNLKTIKLWNQGFVAKLIRNPAPIIYQSELKPNFLNYTERLNNKPLMESQVREFRLVGNWDVTESDLESLLTTYVPFVEKVDFGNLNDGCSIRRIINILHGIDMVGEASGKKDSSDNESRLKLKGRAESFLQRTLLEVKFRGYVIDSDAKEVGLTEIQHPLIEKYESHKMRIYRTLQQVFVKTSDYNTLKGSSVQEERERDRKSGRCLCNCVAANR